MSQVWWYSARAGGLVAWSLLAASVVLGLLQSTRLAGPRLRRPWLHDLHRFVGGLSLVFVGVHVATLVADGYVEFRAVDVLVPFVASWRPGAVALGVVSAWLLVAVWVTSVLRHRLPAPAWRAVHLCSYVAYAATTFHLLAAGSDTGNPLVRALVVGTTGAVAALTGIALSRVLDVQPT